MFLAMGDEDGVAQEVRDSFFADLAFPAVVLLWSECVLAYLNIVDRAEQGGDLFLRLRCSLPVAG
ncbi:hypothetical protein [Pseudomonas sp. KB-10]|uniref:hypothetical protein n=1 Tax=Pseudomonas sp. KB-10 TaxID=2292264 RepID=UPI001BB0C70C|nr:hypothetical protein [Pseudomonas sp. KB-10]